MGAFGQERRRRARERDEGSCCSSSFPRNPELSPFLRARAPLSEPICHRKAVIARAGRGARPSRLPRGREGARTRRAEGDIKTSHHPLCRVWGGCALSPRARAHTPASGHLLPRA